MMAGASGGRFVWGAVGGLALALLVVGLGSFVPQPSAPSSNSNVLELAAASTSTSTMVSASATSQVTSASVPANAPTTAGIGGVAAAPSTTTTTTATASAELSSIEAGVSGHPAQESSPTPATRLSALQGESVGSLVADFAPLLVGLVAAVLVYEAYSRRQDA